ncbi:MAG TPA: hypothetical protein VMA72_19815 [Streptosporangiaceae bacterium]|nr:hypothetical protein [Streptosporangiaceae bacterium]
MAVPPGDRAPLGSELMRAARVCGVMWRAMGTMENSAVRSAWASLSW